jgi:hypothetical protein
MGPGEYPTLAAFYAAEPARRRSPEDEFGADWRAGGRLWPAWRVSYLRATHELYAVALRDGIPGPVRLLGAVPPDPGAHPRRDRHRGMIDKILDGWNSPEITRQDLAWVEQRLAAVQGG